MGKRVFIRNAAVLTASTIVLRLSGIWFRMFITGKIGASGMGLYQLILSVFILGITLCTSGTGLAVTRLVAEGRASRSAVRRCVWFALALSGAAAGGMILFSGPISARLMGSGAAAVPLRMLAPGLPFIAVCACLKGYFLAVRNAVVPVCDDFLEQLVTIAAAVSFMKTMKDPLSALMLGSTVGEIASCAFILTLYRFAAAKRKLPRKKAPGIFREILHISMPVMLGSCFRSLLFSAENLLIPRGLRRHGADEAGALAQYGLMQGMVMPILLFPSAFLSALSTLLIPEIAQANAEKRSASIERSASLAFRWTLAFSFFVTTLLIVFADELGKAFYNNTECANILRIMAPIVPLMYLDSIVDGMLKGLDQQFHSMKYNFSDSVMRVILILALIPVFGIRAYMAILFFSEIYNAALSIHRLLKVTELKVDVVGWILTPAVGAALLYYALILAKKLIFRFV